jgi:hypothetical protein
MEDEWGISDSGHAGFSPQSIAATLRSSRVGAILSSVGLRAASGQRKYAMQPTARLQVPEKASTLLVTQQMEAVAMQLNEAAPNPGQFFPRDFGGEA